jgi:DNA-binding response OmpR family regulator
MGAAAGSIQVLVVEDDDDFRGALCELLKFEGYHPVGCRNGETAWTQLACGLRPRVIVTDLTLPGLSGRQLVGRLREQTWGERLPVLLLSGWGNSDRLGIPATAVLMKGGEPETIVRTVDRLARRDIPRDTAHEPARRPPVRAGRAPRPQAQPIPVSQRRRAPG